MIPIPEDVKALHDIAEQVLLDWLENPPTERREIKALELFAEAGQLLHSACINLGAIEIEG